jgi:putative ABC transport system substrate-binding protein
MRRREFLVGLGGGAAWPLAVAAQHSAMPVIGFLHIGAASPFAHLIVALRQGLRETGYVEGQNLAIEFRWAEGRYERLPALAAELVNRPVAVLG